LKGSSKARAGHPSPKERETKKDGIKKEKNNNLIKQNGLKQQLCNPLLRRGSAEAGMLHRTFIRRGYVFQVNIF